MATRAAQRQSTELDLAREGMYRFLAMALGDPDRGIRVLLDDPDVLDWLTNAAELLTEETRRRGVASESNLITEWWDRTISRLPGRDAWRREYDDMFGLIAAKDCPPYETEFCVNSEPFFRSQQLADIAGFYRAFGLEPSRRLAERPDCLSLELDFLATVLMKRRLATKGQEGSADSEEVEVCTAAFSQFFEDHLIWWAPVFGRLLQQKEPDGFFGAVAGLLRAFLEFEANFLDVKCRNTPLGPNLVAEEEGCDGCQAIRPAVCSTLRS